MINLLLSLLCFCFLSAQFVNANVVGSDTQNFNPTTSGLDYVTIHSSKTLDPGLISFGLYYNYAVNTLTGITDQVQKDSLSALDINFGFGLMENWDIGISFPRILQQRIDEGTFLTQFTKAGATEARVNSKLNLVNGSYLGLATIASVNFPIIDNNPFTGIDPGPTFNLELALDTRFKRFNVAANGGVRIRNPGKAVPDCPILPFQNQFIYSFGASYFFVSSSLKLISEIYGSYPLQKESMQSDRKISTLEWLLGFKKTMNNHLDLNIGGTTEVIHGTATPQWRLYAGLNAAIGPLYGDNNKNVVEKRTKEVQYIIVEDDNEYMSDSSPKKSKKPEKKPSEVIVIRDVVFQSGSSKLAPELESYVDQLAEHIKQTKDLEKVVVEGHTDSVGGRELNMDLSQKRATSVKMKIQNLLGLESNTSKIEAIGYGMDRPIASNENYQGRLRNRRVEIKIFRKGNGKSGSGENRDGSIDSDSSDSSDSSGVSETGFGGIEDPSQY